ncbi:hypothetical protein ABTZ94_37390, partial [Streptomyces sp. NPDC002785]
MAATTGRAVPLPAVAAGAEKPSAEPVLTFSDLLGSRARDRWTAGACPPAPPLGPYAPAGARSGATLRTRTGAAGAEGVEDAEGEDPVAGAFVGVRVSAARWTAAGPGAAGAGDLDAGDESTGIPEGPSVRVGVGTGPAGADGGGAEGSRAGVVPCPGLMAPGCVRRRSPSRGASSRSLAVEGSEGSGAPIPPRVRLGEPALSGGGGVDAPTGPEGFDGSCPADFRVCFGPEDEPRPGAGADWRDGDDRGGSAAPGRGDGCGHADGAVASGGRAVTGSGALDVCRWSTGMPGSRRPAGPDGTTPRRPAGSAGTAPEGSSRSGLPRAGRTVVTSGGPAELSGAGVGAGTASGAGAVAAVPGPPGRSDVIRRTAPLPVTGADGADPTAGGIPVMCRSGIAGRRAMISGGAVRRGRTAAGRVRRGAAGAGTAPSDADAGAGFGPSADAALFVGGVPDVASGAVAPLPRATRPGVPRPEEAGGTGAFDRWTAAGPCLPPVAPRPT